MDPQPIQPVSQTAVTKDQDAVQLVWEWLTYGLWTATLIAIGVLASITVSHFVTHSNGAYEATAYSMAAVICLLPLAYFADRIYSKNEPDHKRGFGAVILVLHAVFATLVGVGSLIATVMAALALVLGTDSNTSPYITTIISAALVAILSSLFFIRIIRPMQLRLISKYFSLIILITAAVVVLLAFIGPFWQGFTSKTDRLIEDNLEMLNEDVRSYATSHGQLPASLGDITIPSYETGVQSLINRQLVTYHQLPIARRGTSSIVTASTAIGRPIIDPLANGRYELCVTYRHAKKAPYQPYTDTSGTDYINTAVHPAGPMCYQQTVNGLSAPRPYL